jgi:hypothetical protein
MTPPENIGLEVYRWLLAICGAIVGMSRSGNQPWPQKLCGVLGGATCAVVTGEPVAIWLNVPVSFHPAIVFFMGLAGLQIIDVFMTEVLNKQLWRKILLRFLVKTGMVDEAFVKSYLQEKNETDAKEQGEKS